MTEGEMSEYIVKKGSVTCASVKLDFGMTALGNSQRGKEALSWLIGHALSRFASLKVASKLCRAVKTPPKVCKRGVDAFKLLEDTAQEIESV
jgi:hypothetical protein